MASIATGTIAGLRMRSGITNLRIRTRIPWSTAVGTRTRNNNTIKARAPKRDKIVEEAWVTTSLSCRLPNGRGLSVTGELARTGNQRLFADALDEDKYKIVVIIGPAGSGKTMLACSAALDAVAKGVYEQVIVIRPTVPVENEQLGHLPGTLENKLAPWLQPIYDNMSKTNAKATKKAKAKAKIVPMSLAHARGRTFERSFVIADEMQNATARQVELLLTRIGEGTKIILTGDLSQCDLRARPTRCYGAATRTVAANGLEDLVGRLAAFGTPVMGASDADADADFEFDTAVEDKMDISGNVNGLGIAAMTRVIRMGEEDIMRSEAARAAVILYRSTKTI